MNCIFVRNRGIKMKNVKEIVKDYLIKNGYDGLSDNDLCECSINNLFNCDSYCTEHCAPIKNIKCSNCNIKSMCRKKCSYCK
jgi:hypothetical protein